MESKIVEHLTRDELLVIGFAYRLQKSSSQDFNADLRAAIQDAGYDGSELEELLMSVGGTGLLSSASAWGGLAYMPTGWLREPGELADIEFRASEKAN
jgi:hypothetical protein